MRCFFLVLSVSSTAAAAACSDLRVVVVGTTGLQRVVAETDASVSGPRSSDDDISLLCCMGECFKKLSGLLSGENSLLRLAVLATRTVEEKPFVVEEEEQEMRRTRARPRFFVRRLSMAFLRIDRWFQVLVVRGRL